jgi:hypothetical protein
MLDHLAGLLERALCSQATGAKPFQVQVIYFYHHAGMPLYLLLAYTKAQATTLTPDETRTLTALAAALKQGKA